MMSPYENYGNETVKPRMPSKYNSIYEGSQIENQLHEDQIIENCEESTECAQEIDLT